MTEASYVTSSSGQQVLVLKQGGASNRGRKAQSNNISAAKLIAEMVRTSLGPRGMDKMLVDGMGDVTVTNDGATMLKSMDVQHPAAKMVIEVSKTVDDEVGDGTTSSVVLTGALLENAEELIEMGIHPMVIVNGYRKAAHQAQRILDKIAVSVAPNDRVTLTRIARTSMASKLVSNDSKVLGEIIVDGILHVAEEVGDGNYRVDLENLKLEKKVGGSIRDTRLVTGIVLDKEVSHSGMPKKIEGAGSPSSAQPSRSRRRSSTRSSPSPTPRRSRSSSTRRRRCSRTWSRRSPGSEPTSSSARRGSTTSHSTTLREPAYSRETGQGD